MNPINLYGEEVLLKKLNNSKIEEIQIWKTMKKIRTEAIDLDVEKKNSTKFGESTF